MLSRAAALALSLAVAVAVGGCPRSPDATRPAPSAADTAALCADLDTLARAAAGNFAEQRGDTPVARDGQDGVTSTLQVRGTSACAILRPDPAYPDDLVECELPGGGPGARAVVDQWAARIATCPVVADWVARSRASGQAWELETDDNHLLTIEVVADDDAGARPVVRVRRPEI